MTDGPLIGGREDVVVELVDHRAEWAERLAVERDRISAALGDRVRRIEHIGSTAVPGLAAKPIVDVMITVDDVENEARYLGDLLAAGYELRVREPGHRMVRTSARDVHVHVWPADSDDEHRHLAFRDRLRANVADRAEYERVKRALAGPYRDGNDYADAKTDVITRIVARAADDPTTC